MKRQHYIDNLRVFLTALVVIFHTSIAYGGAGSWYFEDFNKNQGVTVTMVVFTIFTSVCQAFFMSLFFFVSAYFTPASYDRKGPAKFITDRLVRLGIPLLVFYFVLDPPIVWYLNRRSVESLGAFYQQSVFSFKETFFGPMWFVETLIYFAALYTLFRLIWKRSATGNVRQVGFSIRFPTGKTLFITAILFGFIAFVVRLKYPTGTGPLELQLGYFPLYILSMVMGVAAYRNRWLDDMPTRLIQVWKWLAICLIPVFPLGLILMGALHGNIEPYGGFNGQALLYAMWEPFLCFGISFALLVYFQRRWNITNPFVKNLSGAAYTVYIIHPPFVIAWTLLFHSVPLPEMVKFLIVAPLSVISCFVVASMLVRIPGFKRVL